MALNPFAVLSSRKHKKKKRSKKSSKNVMVVALEAPLPTLFPFLPQAMSPWGDEASLNFDPDELVAFDIKDVLLEKPVEEVEEPEPVVEEVNYIPATR